MANRKSKFKEPTHGIYILGEGITEKYYFQHLKSIYGFKCIVRPRFFGNTCCDKFEKEIKSLLQGDIKIICVLDADVSKRNAVENQKLTKLRKKYIKNSNVKFCESMPSIEYWFLLHYVDTCPACTLSREVERSLKNYISNYEKSKDFLENERWVKDMSDQRGSLKNAITRAKKYDSKSPSYSDIYFAIDQLESTIN